MTKRIPLSEMIANRLSSDYTHATLPEIGDAIGLPIPSADSGASKRERARQALSGKTERELAEIARQLGRQSRAFALEEDGLAVLEKNVPPISEITRRDIAKCFGDDLCGEQDLVGLLKQFFPIEMMLLEGFSFRILEEEIQRHMVNFPGDWSVETLFEQIGAMTCSVDRFGRLIEAALHPLGRRGPDQIALVNAINPVLRLDGYKLTAESELSGHPIYRLGTISRSPSGTPKNLIFASDGPKPEIGLGDAINNDIVILANASSCLVYDKSISRDGLLWADLVEWWRQLQDDSAADQAKALGGRLHQSLASDAERMLFETYFRIYRPRLGDALPALIPQVYLHYDPAVVKTLRHRKGFVRQRMDFLLLLRDGARVVIEVDGSQHFSRDGKPSLEAYAEMVSADRDLRLAGYEIYRFGSNELVGSQAAAKIETFFDRLWQLYKVSGS
jgi:hypothetical protein